MQIPFDNAYARLPHRFYARLSPTPVREPGLIQVNAALAAELGIDASWLASAEGVAVCAGNRVPEGADPLAQAYAGHQFGHFVPQLGDGRAILLGEVLNRNGERRDLQLKGAGPTPFSRGGDGRAWIGPVIREYLLSEAMHALGVPTTRSLAAVTTGESVYREQVARGAVLTRVASSHVRVGTFQYFAVRQDKEALRTLFEYVIKRHDPDVETPLEFLEAVLRRQAYLVAQWLGVGFIHGVLNTDNVAISGETLDYGPCAFLDAYEPLKVFSSVDAGGRYAYSCQPRVMIWNVAQLASALLPLIDEDEDRAIEAATEVIERGSALMDSAWLQEFRGKLGLVALKDHRALQASDAQLIGDFLDVLEEGQADFTNSFRALSDSSAVPSHFATPTPGLAARYHRWEQAWQQRITAQGNDPQAMSAQIHAANPRVIPRNHRVEEAILAAVDGQFAPFERLLAACTKPYEAGSDSADLEAPPKPHEAVKRTFCGT